MQRLPSGTTTSGDPGVGLLAVAVIGLLALLLAFAVWRSRRSGILSRSEPEAVYRGLVGFAGRLGFAQLPTQTTYEYAGALGDLVPAAREELQLVARAKVEVTYGRRAMAGDGLVALHAAYRRLRVRLLRLVFRRERGFRPAARIRVGAAGPLIHRHPGTPTGRPVAPAPEGRPPTP